MKEGYYISNYFKWGGWSASILFAKKLTVPRFRQILHDFSTIYQVLTRLERYSFSLHFDLLEKIKEAPFFIF